MKRSALFIGLLAAATSLAGGLPGAVETAGQATAPAASLTVPAAALNDAHHSTLNFRSDPLDQVLDYLSESGGFIINKEAEGPATVDLGGASLAGWERTLERLAFALKRHGLALSREGRVLTLRSLERVGTSDLEVLTGSDPEAVGRSAQVATQLIPVRYAAASPLANNLRALLPADASISVNENANTLLLVASKTDIRRALKIVAALDSALSRVSSIKVIQVHYADAKQLAAVVQQLFAAPATGQSAQGTGSPGGDFGPTGTPGGTGSDWGTQSGGAGSGRGGVTATADEQSNSLVVSAPEATLLTISDLIGQLDQPVSDLTEVRIFPLRNADPTELAAQLAQLFPDTQSGSSQDQAPAQFGDLPAPPEMQDVASSTASASTLKKARLLAVPDPRTSSILVSAPATRMPLLTRLIAELDASPARKETVQTWELRNADPQDVSQILQDLFSRNNGSRNNSDSANSLIGEKNPLTVRATKQRSATTTAGFGSSGTSGGAGNTGGGGADGF